MIVNASNKNNSDSKLKSAYKHVPHREKPPHLVARRNARERRRVQAVNLAFIRLRKALPIESRGKRVSKVKTLKKAMEYITHLSKLITAANNNNEVESKPSMGSFTSLYSSSSNSSLQDSTASLANYCTPFSFSNQQANNGDRYGQEHDDQFLELDDGSLTDDDSVDDYPNQVDVVADKEEVSLVSFDSDGGAFMAINNDGYQQTRLVQGGAFGVHQGQDHQQQVVNTAISLNLVDGNDLHIGKENVHQLDGLEQGSLQVDGHLNFLGMSMLSPDGVVAHQSRFYNGFTDSMDVEF